MNKEISTKKPVQKSLFSRYIALPQDHGSWVFILSPLLIGQFTANRLIFASFILVVAAMTAFLSRQPITIIVKAYSGRRSKKDLKPAFFWLTIYGLIGAAALGGLLYRGLGYLFYLAIPGIPVFIWHLFLVSRRSERRQMGVELVGSGVLALSAPAAYWVGIGQPDPKGWLLFILVWLQSAASIVYAYLRLEQRTWVSVPDLKGLLKAGNRSILYTSFNLALTLILGFLSEVPKWVFLPFLLQWLETQYGVFRPAIRWKPTLIGVRQLIISSLFTLLFIIMWRIG